MNGNRELGTGVNFTRPELSPCLKGLADEKRAQALALILAGAAELTRCGRPDMLDHAVASRERMLVRERPAGALADAPDVLFDLTRERKVAAFEFILGADSRPPRVIDVIDGAGRVLAADVPVPTVVGFVTLVNFKPVTTAKIGFRVKEGAPGGGWSLKAVHVRVPTFAGHLVLGK